MGQNESKAPGNQPGSRKPSQNSSKNNMKFGNNHEVSDISNAISIPPKEDKVHFDSSRNPNQSKTTPNSQTKMEINKSISPKEDKVHLYPSINPIQSQTMPNPQTELEINKPKPGISPTNQPKRPSDQQNQSLNFFPSQGSVNECEPFGTTQVENRTVPFQTQEQTFEEEPVLFFTIEPESKKIDDQLLPKFSKKSSEKGEAVKFVAGELNRQKHEDRLATLLKTNQKVEVTPVIRSTPEAQVDFLKGQPLMQSKSVCPQPGNRTSFSNSPAKENKSLDNLSPVKKVISSGNPFLQSSATGHVAKDCFQVHGNQPSVVFPNTANHCVKITGVDSHAAQTLGNSKQMKRTTFSPLKGSNGDESVKKTLQHNEIIAESLISSTGKNHTHEKSVETELAYSQTEKSNSLFPLLHNFIARMNNLSYEDKESVSSFQKELVTHLKEISLLTSALKTSPVINCEIYSVCENINTNLCSLKESYENKSTERNIDVICTVNADEKPESHTMYSEQNVRKTLFDNDSINEYAPAFNFVDGNMAASSVVTKELILRETAPGPGPSNTLMSLLCQLPDDLIEEKQNISIKNSNLFCRICRREISFVILNLIEHLRGKNHRALSAGLKSNVSAAWEKSLHFSYQDNLPLETKPTPPVYNARCSQNTSQSQRGKEPMVNMSLSPNYEGILDLISMSVKEGFNIGIEMFICLFCDCLENDKNKALKHVKMSHTDQQNASWHFCKTCLINIFGTNTHFKEHSLTSQHLEIQETKHENCPEESENGMCLPDTASATEEFDRVSVCSSRSDVSNRSRTRMSPHEIMLAIAKEKKDKNIAGPYGLYCHICRKYFNSIPYTPHFETMKHSQALKQPSNRKRVNLTVTKCSICEVYMFGDNDVWKEHCNLQIHKELSALGEKKPKTDKLEEINLERKKETRNLDLPTSNSSDLTEPNISCANNNQSLNSEPNYSKSIDPELLSSFNERGPHYDLMKNILKKHLEKTPVEHQGYYGWYCNLCNLYFLDQKQWETHLENTSHKARFNSPESIGKRVKYECSICNIELICNETFFSMHLQSLAHKAIFRIPNKKQASEESESEVDSEDESNSSEDNNEDEAKQSSEVGRKGNLNDTTCRGGRNQKVICIENGIYCKGLPKEFEYKDVAEFFSRFGPLKSCKVVKSGGYATVIFKNKIDARILLEKSTFHIKKSQVTVRPLMGSESVLTPEVAQVLSSSRNIMTTVVGVLNEMKQNHSVSQLKRSEIGEDLFTMVPNCRVHFFGSQVTGLATWRSDFDVYLDADGKSFYNDLSSEQQQGFISHLQHVLSQRGSKFTVKEVILVARVPIIKVVHLRTNSLCDISCRSGLSVENSLLISMYLNMDRRVRWLVVAIKFWMDANGLLDRTIFTSYASVWLVLFFLMRLAKPVVCPVVTLQRDCKPYTVSKWDCRFHRDIQDVIRYFRSSNRHTEIELLAQFFQMYAQFSFKGIVLCPLTGQLIPRQDFESLKLPRVFSPYLDKLQFSKEAERLRTQTPICLQDPFDLSHNITKGVRRCDMTRFKHLCRQSANMCSRVLTRQV